MNLFNLNLEYPLFLGVNCYRMFTEFSVNSQGMDIPGVKKWAKH